MKKLITMGMCLVMAVTMLAGCKVALTDETKPEDTVTSQPKENDAQENENGTIVKYGKELTNLSLDGTLSKQYEGQSIVVPVMSGDFEKAINDVVPIFEELTGADVIVESVPGEQFTDKLQLDLNNTKRYDIVLAPIAFLHSFAASQKIEPLQPMIDQYAGASYDTGDFIPALFETYGMYQGSLYAIPYKPDVELLFYRKDLFEDEAVKASFKEKYGRDLEVPKTNEELMEVAGFFTKSANPDSPVDYGYSTNMMKGCTRLLFINRGGDDVNESLQPNMNNQEGIDALNRVLELQKYAPKEWMQMGWDEANQFFANGNAAMMEQWPGLWNTCQADGSAVKDKIGVAMAPGATPVLGGWGVGISAGSKNKELAWKFVEFITSKDGELLKIENTMDPCRTSTYAIDEVSKSSALYDALMESLKYAKTLADVDIPYVSSKLNDVMELHIQEAMNGNVTPEKALADMEAEFQKEIEGALQ
ncbi:MAG TPA: sugar ABC transporter substrate-binding protein [Clostridiales bacterium]|nr:sugar ABC transporter substrate-binding protein [Clostridiales bacterium]